MRVEEEGHWQGGVLVEEEGHGGFCVEEEGHEGLR